MKSHGVFVICLGLFASGHALAQQQCGGGVCSMPPHLQDQFLGVYRSPPPLVPAREDVYAVVALSPNGGASVARDYDDPDMAKRAASLKCAEKSDGEECTIFPLPGPYCFSLVRGRTDQFMGFADDIRQAMKQSIKACEKAKDKPCHVVSFITSCNKLVPVGSPTRPLLVWFDESDLRPRDKK